MAASPNDDLTDRITIRCTAAQRELWEKASAESRRRLADWIRLSLDDVAEGQLRNEPSKNNTADEKGARRTR